MTDSTSELDLIALRAVVFSLLNETPSRVRERIRKRLESDLSHADISGMKEILSGQVPEAVRQLCLKFFASKK